jgi:hypothetical protein
LKLINLLKNFFFKKSILFNILKKIKIFNNILTLNFNLIYSTQSNSIFITSKILKLTQISSKNLTNINLLINKQVDFIKNAAANFSGQSYSNIFLNIFNKKNTNDQVGFFNKNITPEFISFLKANKFDTKLKTALLIKKSNNPSIFLSSYNSKINNFFKFLSYESSFRIKNFTKLNLNNKIQLLNENKLISKSLVKTPFNFADYKLKLTIEKILLYKTNVLKILTTAQVLNKLANSDLIKSNLFNFKFYNETNKVYSNILLSNLKLKEILNSSLNDK